MTDSARQSMKEERRAKTVAILQSNYLPWRGYFDIIRRCDIFIFFDVVQYTKNDWRNRNLIKTPSGRSWLTIPVRRHEQPAIDQAAIADAGWVERHIRSLQVNYARAPAFDSASPWLFALLRACEGESSLSQINQRLLCGIAERLSFETRMVSCLDLLPREDIMALERSERLAALCRLAGASTYLSGPAAKTYLDEAAFHRAGITVSWMSYDDYPAYPQLWSGYDPGLSIIDLLLNTGDEARAYFPS